MQFIPGVSAIEGVTPDAVVQVIGEHGGIERAIGSDWPTLGNKGCTSLAVGRQIWVLYRRLADALVSDGRRSWSTKLKAPRSCTQTTRLMPASRISSQPRCSCQSEHHHVDRIVSEESLETSREPHRAESASSTSRSRSAVLFFSRQMFPTRSRW